MTDEDIVKDAVKYFESYVVTKDWHEFLLALNILKIFLLSKEIDEAKKNGNNKKQPSG